MTAERQAEFLAEHKANFNAFKNEPRLLDDWGEFLDINMRKNINHLVSYNYVKRPYVIDKLAQVKSINGKWVGGHLGSEAFDTSKPIYLILDSGVVPESKQIGNRIYKQVKRTSIDITDRTTSIRKKGVHTWIEGISKQEFTEDVAYAFTNKVYYMERIEGDGARGIIYKSHFKDGTKVTITIREPHWIDEYDEVFSNHLTAILIEPTF